MESAEKWLEDILLRIKTFRKTLARIREVLKLLADACSVLCALRQVRIMLL